MTYDQQAMNQQARVAAVVALTLDMAERSAATHDGSVPDAESLVKDLSRRLQEAPDPAGALGAAMHVLWAHGELPPWAMEMLDKVRRKLESS